VSPPWPPLRLRGSSSNDAAVGHAVAGMTLHADVDAHATLGTMTQQLRLAVGGASDYDVVVEYDGGLATATDSVLLKPPLLAKSEAERHPARPETTVVVQFHLRGAHMRMLHATSRLMQLAQQPGRFSAAIRRLYVGPRPVVVSTDEAFDDAPMPPNGRQGIPYWDSIRFRAVCDNTSSTRTLANALDRWLHQLEYTQALYAAADVSAFNPDSLERTWTFTGQGSNATLVAHVFNKLSNVSLLHLFGIIELHGAPIEPPLPNGLPYDRNLYFDLTFFEEANLLSFNNSLATLLWAPNYAALNAVQQTTGTLSLKLYFNGPDRLALAHRLAVVPADAFADRLGVVSHDTHAFPPPTPQENGGHKIIFVLVGIGIVVVVIAVGLVLYLKRTGNLPTSCPCKRGSSGDDYEDWAMATDRGGGSGGGGGGTHGYSNDLAAYHRLK